MRNTISLDHLLVIIMIIYVIYIVIKKKDIIQEHFEVLNISELDNVPPMEPPLPKSNKQCSNTSINDAVFRYSLSKLNQIKTPN